MASESLHVLIAGRVQGVGFRFSARQEAAELGLEGWVRNLPDGRVEGEFTGERSGLDRMLAWCRVGPAFARVDDVEATWGTSESAGGGVRIR